MCGARRLGRHLRERRGDRSALAVEGHRQRRRDAERADQLLRPCLRDAALALVDLRVRAGQVQDRVHLRGQALHDRGDRTVGAVLTKQRAVRAVPLGVDPHAAALGVARDQLVPREVHHPQRVARDGQRGRARQALPRAQLPVVHGGHLRGREAAAQDEQALLVEPLDRVRHPVVAARQVVARQVSARRAPEAAALPDGGRHVAGLAREESRRPVLVVAALPGLLRLLERVGDRPLLQLGRQRRHLRDGQRVEHARLELAERALHHAVLVGEVVERGLALHRRARRPAERARRQRDLGAVARSQVAGEGVGDVVAGAAQLRRAVVLRLRVRMGRAGRGVGPQLGGSVGRTVGRTVPEHVLAGAVVADRVRSAAARDERLVLHAQELGRVRVREPVTLVAFDAVDVAHRVERGAVGRHRTARQPAGGDVAA